MWRTKKQSEGMDYAVKKGFPVVNLGEAAGGRTPKIMGAPGMMGIVLPIDKPPRDRYVPYSATE